MTTAGEGKGTSDVGPALGPLDDLVRVVTKAKYASWNQLCARWTKVVETVNSGYPFTIYDYRNDVDARSIVEDVLDTARRRGIDVPTAAAERLAALDAQFIALTRDAAQTIATRATGPWASRVPLHPGEELEMDMRREGI